VTASFDLRDRPWIPARGGASLSMIGLRELFLRAHELDDLALAVPPAASGLWRILYAITYRITGLDDPTLSPDDWHDRRYELLDVARRFDAARIAAYFDLDRFDLFDRERPWLQDPRLSTECPKPSGVNKLVFVRPSGSNQVWFGHFDDLQARPLPAAEAAWYLIAQHFYGASGRCSTRVVNGRSEANTTAGPLRGVVSFHPRGRNVFESLLCGLVSPAAAADIDQSVMDRCPWERDALADPLGRPTAPAWPVGLIVGQSRHALLLVPDASGEQVIDAYLTWAWREPGVEAADPYVIRQISKEGRQYAKQAEGSRALWRDLDALLGEPSAGRASPQPIVLEELAAQVPEEVHAALRIEAHGFDQDGQAKDRQWFTATTPPVLKYLRNRDPAGLTRMAGLRVAAEDVASVLKRALRDAWSEATGPTSGAGRGSGRDSPWAARAAAFYWPRAEREFWRWYDQAEQPPPYHLFVAVARAAIDHATGEQERQLRFARSAAQARRRVGGLAKATRRA
jgi:CRISPR system Cascade subunit CasA